MQAGAVEDLETIQFLFSLLDGTHCETQDFCTPSTMSQKGGELTFPGLLTALTLTAMGRLPKVLLTIKSARGGLSR